jgi:hypothetical protein
MASWIAACVAAFVKVHMCGSRFLVELLELIISKADFLEIFSSRSPI